MMFLYRADYQGMGDENTLPGETNVIIAKHRNGEIGDVKMRFLHSECRFVDFNDYTYVTSRMNIQ